MLRLFTNYKEEAQADYQATLTVLNSSVTHQRGALNQQLYEISNNIRLIDKAISQYQDEKKALEKDIRLSMGLSIIDTKK
jgi:septal ring factor EnvC (AmiA/AmiB activator)